MLWTISSITFK